MMLVAITITCLIGLTLGNPIPQQQRLDEYQSPGQFPVLPTLGEPLSQSPLPLTPEGVNTAHPPTGQPLSGNQTNPPVPPTQGPAPLHSSSQSLSSSQSQSQESQSESSQEITSDESPEDTASEQTTSEQSSESLPNTSEDTTSEEMALNADGQQFMGHMLDEINGDTQDNSLGSEENMRRSRILAFGIPLRPQLAPEQQVVIATHSPSVSEGVTVQPVPEATVHTGAHDAVATVSVENDNSLESAECTATADNGACVRNSVFNPMAEGEQPGLSLLMLEEERGQLHL